MRENINNISQLIMGCKSKQHKYQEMLYHEFLGFALKTVFRYISRYEKAVDVVNDGFVRLFKNFDRFGNTGNEEENRKLLFGYIRRIMVNAAIDELRKGSMLPEIVNIPDSVWDTSSKDHDADQLLLYKQVITKIKELPPNYRVVFNLHIIDGFNHLEIADMLKIPVGTSKSNLARARVMLQNSINKSEATKLCTI
jgi:RNA polymerase sigma factor (sigma-70 family)